jgi:hypothetical protein
MPAREPHVTEKGYKWKRNYQGMKVKDAWFILTDLGSLPFALSAYKQRMGIEESYLDCKTGGYIKSVSIGIVNSSSLFTVDG